MPCHRPGGPGIGLCGLVICLCGSGSAFVAFCMPLWPGCSPVWPHDLRLEPSVGLCTLRMDVLCAVPSAWWPRDRPLWPCDVPLRLGYQPLWPHDLRLGPGGRPLCLASGCAPCRTARSPNVMSSYVPCYNSCTASGFVPSQAVCPCKRRTTNISTG